MLLGLAVGAPAAAGSSGAGEAGTVFPRVKRSTVEIQSRVIVPFIEDRRGAFSGAGFIVRTDPLWIMTNAHVVGHSGFNPIRVAVAGEEFRPAEPVFIDSHLDLAVLRLKGEAWEGSHVPVALDCGDLPEAGTPVAAFGHPWGYRYTGTRGIVSGSTVRDQHKWLQTDAPLNEGNSGGPLVDLKTGRVVGINTAKAGGGEAENLNLATPMKYACRVLELLKAGRDPTLPRLPVQFASGHRDKGLLVAAVRGKGVPLRPGDRITGLAGEAPADNLTELFHGLRGQPQRARLAVRRKEKGLTPRVALDRRTAVLERRAVAVSGLVIASSGLADGGELGEGDPLMIHSVSGDGWGRAAGFEPWDFVLRVDGRAFSRPRALLAHLREQRAKDASARFLVRRVANGTDSYFQHRRLKLPIRDLKWLVPEDGKGG